MATQEDKKSIAWLKDHVEGTLGEEVAPARLRAILRQLVGSGEIEHEARTGWTFTGIKDPAVRAVIAKLKEAAKAEKAPAVKKTRAEKKAPAAKRTPSRRKPAPEPEDDDNPDHIEDDDIDLDY